MENYPRYIRLMNGSVNCYNGNGSDSLVMGYQRALVNIVKATTRRPFGPSKTLSIRKQKDMSCQKRVCEYFIAPP